MEYQMRKNWRDYVLAEFSRETEPMGYVESNIERRIIIGIGSRGCGGWKIPQSALGKLEIQKSQWYNLVYLKPS